MSAPEVPLVIHVGYPKTATTTFQQHVFPHHPEIEYLGKFIPSFRYVDESMYGLVDELLHRSAIGFRGTANTPRALLSKPFSLTELQTVVSATSKITPKQRRIVVKFGGTSLAYKKKANGTKLAVVVSATVKMTERRVVI